MTPSSQPDVLASVVVPAHNEAAVIDRCLVPLVDLARAGRLQVVVAVNGSTDDTAARARAALAGCPAADVLDLPEPSKIAALRAGDRAATAFPRIYLDADVEVSTAVLEDLARVLAGSERAVVAAPGLEVDVRRSSPLVRAYYAVWTRLPYSRDGVIGSGLYAVNAAGREVLGEFPDVLNDDGWIRRSFAPGDRVRSAGSFTVHAPTRVGALVSRRARIAVGNRQLDATHTDESAVGLRGLRAGVRRGEYGRPQLLAFLAVTVAARVLGRWRSRGARRVSWGTDVTSRVATAPDAGGRP